MKSWGGRLLAIAALVAGGVVGYLNNALVTVDLVWLRFETRLGVALLGAFAGGVLGGLAWGVLSAGRRRPPPVTGGAAGDGKPSSLPVRD